MPHHWRNKLDLNDHDYDTQNFDHQELDHHASYESYDSTHIDDHIQVASTSRGGAAIGGEIKQNEPGSPGSQNSRQLSDDEYSYEPQSQPYTV